MSTGQGSIRILSLAQRRGARTTESASHHGFPITRTNLPVWSRYS
jgi:hypothetical protein